MDNTLEKLFNLLQEELEMQCPVLSGNMLDHIAKLGSIGNNDRTIIISAPFYDLEEWKKTKKIKHTGDMINGKTDYAYWVNELGGFATGNRSKHWVNRAISDTVNAIANEIGAEVINELEL